MESPIDMKFKAKTILMRYKEAIDYIIKNFSGEIERKGLVLKARGLKLKFVPENDPSEILFDGILGELWLYTIDESSAFSEIYEFFGEVNELAKEKLMLISQDIIIKSYALKEKNCLKFGVILYMIDKGCKAKPLKESYEGCRM